MTISETQLTTWSTLPSSKQHRDTYASIRGVLLDSRAPYHGRSKDVYLQGSYGNDTNVYADSDVDIVICSDASFSYDLDHILDIEKRAFQNDHPSVGLSIESFQTDVYAWLRSQYGSDVQPPKKAMQIKATNSRRAADVLICTEHRQHINFNGSARTFWPGVKFITSDGTAIINFPKEHAKQCTAKHQATNDWFKPTVRIFKNMRNRMIEKGSLQDGVAPSYYIEGALSNVPNGHYGVTYANTVASCLDWLQKANKDRLLCAHNLRWLVRDNKPDSWPTVKFDTWLSATINFWNAGG